MWLRERRNSASSTFRRIDSGIITARRNRARRACPGFDDGIEQGRQVGVDIDRDHLRARHHHVADHHLGDADRALDHRVGFAAQQAVALRFAEFREQFFRVARFA
jgi:hypothetical protein